MSDIVQDYEERLQEIETYLDLLDELEKQIQDRSSEISQSGIKVTVQQQRILYSSVYLLLYNLVEATMTWCIDAYCQAAIDGGTWKPGDLAEDLRREWVRYIAQTHIELNCDNRLKSALYLCNHLLKSLPVSNFIINKGGGGNWDDKAIEDMSSRLGLKLLLSDEVNRYIKKHYRDDKSPLSYIKDLRNDLAHGRLSFYECGQNVTVRELRNLKEETASYLREVINSFKVSIDSFEFLTPEKRPIETVSITNA